MEDKKPKNFTALFITIASASLLGWYVNAFPPETFFHYLWFFLIITVLFGSFFYFLFQVWWRSCLYTGGIILFLLLRLLGLKHILYAILLFIILVLTDLSRKRMKK